MPSALVGAVCLFTGLWLHNKAQQSFPKNARGWFQTPTSFSAIWTIAVTLIIYGVLAFVAGVAGDDTVPTSLTVHIGTVFVIAIPVALFHFVSVQMNPERKRLIEEREATRQSQRAATTTKERESVDRRLKQLEPLFNVAYAKRADFTPERERAIASERRDDFLDRAEEIERAYTDTSSPIWNEAECATVAAFLKAHASHNSNIGVPYESQRPLGMWDRLWQWWENASWRDNVRSSNGNPNDPDLVAFRDQGREQERFRQAYRDHHGSDPPDELVYNPDRRGLSEREIARLLYAYHCHEWNVLQHAQRLVESSAPEPAAHTEAEEFAHGRVSFRKGADRARKEILTSGKERAESIEADESLSREEKDRLIEAVRQDTQRDLETLDRKARRL